MACHLSVATLTCGAGTDAWTGHRGLLGQAPWGDRTAAWQDGGSGRRCQPYRLFVLTWLEVCLFLEAAGAVPSPRSPFRPLCAHLPPVRSQAKVPSSGFLLSQRCPLLLDQNVAPQCAVPPSSLTVFLRCFLQYSVGKPLPGPTAELLCRIVAVSEASILVKS